MSDNILFEIQMEIIEKVSHVKSLIRFRSVSKSWKSFIDSSDFIKGYGARHRQPRTRILSLSWGYYPHEKRYVVDYDMESFMVQQEYDPYFVASPLLNQHHVTKLVGACHGLLCLFTYNTSFYDKSIVVIWNPCIGKSFGIALPSIYSWGRTYFGKKLFLAFGVSPVTRDPTVVMILYAVNMPCNVEVFTLSSGVWNVIPSGNLPRQSIKLDSSTHVVIDRFIYWGAREKISTDDGESTTNLLVVSFDLITKEFKVVDLPDSLTYEIIKRVSVSKLRGSLVVSGYVKVEEELCCGVWVMEHDSSFRKLFTIVAPFYKILGFRKNDEPIFEIQKADGRDSTLKVYDPYSQQIKNPIHGFIGKDGSFVMGSYKESLLLLDHSDLHIYSNHS